MYLQDVESILDLSWNGQRGYGEILQQLFALYEAEATDLVAAGLPAPALLRKLAVRASR